MPCWTASRFRQQKPKQSDARLRGGLNSGLHLFFVLFVFFHSVLCVYFFNTKDTMDLIKSIRLFNEVKASSMQHNFILIEHGSADKVAAEGMKAGVDNNYTPKMKDVMVGTSLVGPGKKTEIICPAPPKGTYDFICTYPGHYK